MSALVILTRSLDSHIKPCLELLESLFGSIVRTVEAVLCVMRLLSSDFKGTFKPNIELLITEGVLARKKPAMTHLITLLHIHDKMENGISLKNLCMSDYLVYIV